jgi:signal transduction histidine kinase
MIKSEPDSFRRENLVKLWKENENLVKLINILAELTDAPGTEKSSYKFERLDLGEFVNTVLRATSRSFQEKNIHASVDCATPNIFIRADRTRMEFVLSTLLKNACLYTLTGRNVTIAITAKRRKAIVSVIDDGIGINPIDMTHIFSRFFRAKNAQTMDTEGLGVSLYLASSITKRHHGRLNAFSAGLNTGSTFSIILPRVE